MSMAQSRSGSQALPKSRPPSAAGGRGSKGSGQPAARPDPLLGRSSAGPHQTPRAQVSRNRALPLSSREVPRITVRSSTQRARPERPVEGAGFPRADAGKILPRPRRTVGGETAGRPEPYAAGYGAAAPGRPSLTPPGRHRCGYQRASQPGRGTRLRSASAAYC